MDEVYLRFVELVFSTNHREDAVRILAKALKRGVESEQSLIDFMVAIEALVDGVQFTDLTLAEQIRRIKA
jgi:hypothetical protein